MTIVDNWFKIGYIASVKKIHWINIWNIYFYYKTYKIIDKEKNRNPDQIYGEVCLSIKSNNKLLFCIFDCKYFLFLFLKYRLFTIHT